METSAQARTGCLRVFSPRPYRLLALSLRRHRERKLRLIPRRKQLRMLGYIAKIVSCRDAEHDQHYDRQHDYPHADAVALLNDNYPQDDGYNPENGAAEQPKHRKNEPKNDESRGSSWNWRLPRWSRDTPRRRRRGPRRRLAFRTQRTSTLPACGARREVARPAVRAGNPIGRSAHVIPPEHVCLLFCQPAIMSFYNHTAVRSHLDLPHAILKSARPIAKQPHVPMAVLDPLHPRLEALGLRAADLRLADIRGELE